MVRYLALTSLFIALAGGPALGGEPVTGRTGGLVPAAWDGETPTAHEWGTFTSVTGSDGAVLAGLSHEETDLPDFVHDLRDRTGVTGVSPKMETPVIYFYSPEERRVEVDVRFPRGTITQWYPAASSVNHALPMVNGVPATPSGHRITTHENGFIRWGDKGHQGDLIVLGREPGPDAPRPPAVGPTDPWRFCRQVDANLLRACHLRGAGTEADAPDRTLGFEHERCLFYRGLGDFPLPLVASVEHESVEGSVVKLRLTLGAERSDEPLRHLFLVWVRDGRCGFDVVRRVDRSRTIDVALELEPVDRASRRLAAEMAERLVSTGLFRDEARAMVNTWSAGYFHDEGLRALYVLPTAFVDRELPLTIRTRGRRGAPETPWKIVRTFVGRSELLTPRDEDRIDAAVRAFALGDAAEREAALATIDRWGRFALPFLQRAHALAADPAVKRAATAEIERRHVIR